MRRGAVCRVDLGAVVVVTSNAADTTDWSCATDMAWSVATIVPTFFVHRDELQEIEVAVSRYLGL